VLLDDTVMQLIGIDRSPVAESMIGGTRNDCWPLALPPLRKKKTSLESISMTSSQARRPEN